MANIKTRRWKVGDRIYWDGTNRLTGIVVKVSACRLSHMGDDGIYCIEYSDNACAGQEVGFLRHADFTVVDGNCGKYYRMGPKRCKRNGK